MSAGRAGNRLTNTISDNAGPIRTETYGYDALSRLTNVNYGDGQTQSYSFDRVPFGRGNRLTKTDSLTGTEGYTYNAANMLLSRNGQAYTNDANGNTLSGGGRTMTWDGQNRLVSCLYNGVTTTHTYGADGLRRRTVQGGMTTDYVLDGQSVIRTLRNGVLDKTWLHGPRGPEYERDASGNVVWYLYDGLGSVLGTVDPAGNLVSTRKYDVYGSVRGSTGPAGPKHRFVGGLGHPSEEETGLISMRARYYDPITGRFISEDPALDGVNWYAYAGGNPVNAVDPSGHTRNSVESALAQAIASGDVDSVGTIIEAVTDSETAEAIEAMMRSADLPRRMSTSAGRLNSKTVQSCVRNILEHAQKIAKEGPTGRDYRHHLGEIKAFIEKIGKALKLR